MEGEEEDPPLQGGRPRLSKLEGGKLGPESTRVGEP